MQPTEEQAEAALLNTDAAVIAPAGTGKTTVVTLRYLNALKSGLRPANIIAFTFTEKAAAEMRERIIARAGLSDEAGGTLNISTIHAFLASLLRRHGACLSLGADFEILDGEAHKALEAEELRQRIAKAIADANPAVTDFLSRYGVTALKSVFAGIQALPVVAPELPRDDAMLADIVALSLSWQREALGERRTQGALSFDDLESLATRLLEDFPAVRDAVARRYQLILLDEFQDTSPRQLKLLKLMHRPGTNLLFAVGDPKQAIYGFRRAGLSTFHELAAMIHSGSGVTRHLTRTFRTPPRLMAFCNAVFPRLLGGDSADSYIPLATGNTRADDGVYAEIPDDRADTPTSDRYAANTDRIAPAVSLIVDLLGNGALPGHIAVISATRKHFSALREKLSALGIACVSEKRSHPLDAPLTRLLYHALLFAAGINDKAVLAGICGNPYVGVGEISGLEAVDGPLAVKIASTRELASLLPATAIADAVFTDSVPNPTALELGEWRRFVNLLASWQRRGFSFCRDVANLLRAWETLAEPAVVPEPEAPGVRLLTVHGAKGLEFEHVLLIPSGKIRTDAGMFLWDETGGFAFKTPDPTARGLKTELIKSPAYSALEKEQRRLDDAEIRRQIYVAVTRARGNLFLFPPPASKKLSEQLKTNPADANLVKSYNDGLAWLARQEGIIPLADTSLRRDEVGLRPDGVRTSAPRHLGTVPNIGNSAPRQINTISNVGTSAPRHIGTILTVTDLETYAECPKRFALAEYLGIRVPRHKTASTMNETSAQQHITSTRISRLSPSERGTLLHEVLKFFDPARDNLTGVVEQALFNQTITDDGSILAECRRITEAVSYDADLTRLLFHPAEALHELEFTLSLDGFLLTGQIDKLVRANPVDEAPWVIVDYKTHRVNNDADFDALMTRFKFQMLCYALAVTQMSPVKSRQNDVTALILFTHTVKPRYFHFSVAELDEFREDAERLGANLLKDVAQNRFALTNDEVRCQSCPYFEHDFCGVKSSG